MTLFRKGLVVPASRKAFSPALKSVRSTEQAQVVQLVWTSLRTCTRTLSVVIISDITVLVASKFREYLTCLSLAV